MRRCVAALAIAALGLSGTSLAQAPTTQAQRPPSGEYTGPRHISDALVGEKAAALADQSTSEKWKRTATLPEDWNYRLAPGVTTKQVSFYVDGGTRLQGKIFYPKGFDTRSSFPGVVVAHGINALAIGIEKYAAKFAERGIVAMAFDYQSYGFSDSGADELFLLEPDTTTDASPVTVRKAPVRIKRTNLNNVEEVKAFRAAVSFLQGEPGVDPDHGVFGAGRNRWPRQGGGDPRDGNATRAASRVRPDRSRT
jgi:hypothetical protein